jgi:hypothetical protein
VERTGAERGRRRRLLVVLTAVALLVLGAGAAVVAVGDDDESRDFDVSSDVEPLGDERAGSVASLVECADWVEGSVERKQATVVDIREQLSGGGTIEGRPAISDQDAYDTFERACENDFTARFQLYKIYFRANAFSGFDPSAIEQPPAPEPSE